MEAVIQHWDFNFPPGIALFGTFVSLSAFKHLVGAVLMYQKPREVMHVGAISSVFIYPVKSCRGLELQSAVVTRCGLVDPESGVGDRYFMLVDESMNFISQRKEPRLSMVTPSINQDFLHLDAPGLHTLILPLRPQITPNTDIITCRVWGDDVVGADCGPEAASWFSEYLGWQVTLVHSGQGLKRRQLHEDYGHICRPYDKVTFQDWGQVLAISDASLTYLNTRLQTPINMDHFRPNFTITGTLPHAEDTWHKLYIGDVQFTNIKLCGRCSMTTVDPDRGVKSADQQPLAILKSYRKKPGFSDPCFGINVFCDVEGTIRTGDIVEVTSQNT